LPSISRIVYPVFVSTVIYNDTLRFDKNIFEPHSQFCNWKYPDCYQNVSHLFV